MTKIAIRKSGGASIVSLPKIVLKIIGLEVGSELELTIEKNKIILTPLKKDDSLEVLLAGSPKAKLGLSVEDREWLNEKPKGKEI